MHTADLIQRQRAVLRELVRLAGQRSEEEARLDRALASSQAATVELRDATLAELEARYTAESAAAQRQFETDQQQLAARYERDRQQAEQTAQATVEQLGLQLAADEKRAEQALNEARWLAQSVYEADRKRQKQQFEQVKQQLESRLETALAAEREARAFLDQLGALPSPPEPPSEPAEPSSSDDSSQDLAAQLAGAISTAEAQLEELKSLQLVRLMHGAGGVLIFGFPAAVLIPLIGFLIGWTAIPWLAGGGMVGALAGLGLVLWLRKMGDDRARECFASLQTAVREAQQVFQRCLKRAAAIGQRQLAESKSKRDADVARAVETHNPAVLSARQRRQTELPRLKSDAAARLVDMQSRHEAQKKAASQRHGADTADAKQRYEQARDETRQAAEQKLAAEQASHNQRRKVFLAQWQQAFSAAKLEVAAIRREVDRTCPDWKSRAWFDWQPPDEPARAISFGRMTLDLAPQFGDSAGLSELAGQGLEFTLPALLGFPDGASLFIRSQEGGRARAVELLQVAAMRLLTTVPPGKLRLTIIDPVGLGQNFAAFMHLADFDEALISHRIWTEPHQIEQRLGDLTAHMETVIQKYLRSEFATIEEYNAKAGEIAEPFRLLIVANFPTGFTENAARRLASIIASGPRCGVYTLLSAEAGATLPAGLKPADLQSGANIFAARADRLVWKDPDFEDLPLTADEFPPADWCKTVLQMVGKAAVQAKRVEVPFEAIAPPADRYWTSDSRGGIDVPLGRAGATQLQHLRLGQGTAQHVLIAGKTGSGKSTLLHALIVNAALRYSPDELELYLIDFKKGVEFKTYVTHALPHARVVAIESEREFGLSVMQRLDAEMNARGELFRERGVQDIAGFRNAGGELPRILLLVDEFQEFFVADDKLSQEASLLLDRLVRQGRAFGIHVHLGSQTLGGAYSLARSTLGQMAIRIALQCAEADANLILNEDNSAARLLSRPGEAIYNDANGLVEGNHPFQVVWLPDDRREEFLRRVRELAERRPPKHLARQIVFEGTQPADLARNEEIYQLLAAPPPRQTPRVPQVWLGEPLAIQSATSTPFSRRSGANVLWMGQNDEAVAGMMTAAVVGLARQIPPADVDGDRVQSPPGGTQFFLFDGGTIDGPQVAPFRRLAVALAPRMRLFGVTEIEPAVAQLAAELERRRSLSAEALADVPSLFVLVYDLSRFRSLRRQEDDFGFSGFSGGGEEKPPRADKQFGELLREGPAYGVHLLVWCDTLTNFNRTLDRQGLREFDSRVLLQMSAADSSLLIDLPTASQLGRRRALLHREDEGRLEKFRPFAVPDDEWLAAAAERLRSSD